MKILVTGATGFIGQNLVKEFVSSNFDIFCIVRKDSDISKIDKKAKIFRYDGNIEKLLNFFQKEKFDGVIHLASAVLSEHISTDINNLVNSNILFGTSLLEACKLSNVKWFINTGTFWQNYQNEQYNPVNLYASTKEAFKNIAKYYTETSDLIFTTIKLNDTFGKNDTRNKVFNLWAKIAKSGEVLKMSKGEQIIDISYIEDIINAYKILALNLNSKDLKNDIEEEYVISNSQKMSLKDLSKLFEKVTHTKLNIVWGGREYRHREVMIPYTKGKSIPNWKQKYTLEEAIKRTIGN